MIVMIVKKGSDKVMSKDALQKIADISNDSICQVIMSEEDMRKKIKRFMKTGEMMLVK